MALEIKAIPTLRGKEAERKQVKIARAILKKANML